MLILSVVLFIVVALPSGYDQLGAELGISTTDQDPLTFTKILSKFENDEDGLRQRINSLFSDTDEAGQKRSFGDHVSNIFRIGRPLAKVYLDQLFRQDFPQIASSFFGNIFQLSIYALIPGLAGLIYRRNFLGWFLVSFILLFGLNASGAFGSLTAAKPMPGSGWLFFFIVVQIALLVLAFRLRRHAQGLRFIPRAVFNGLLAVFLIFVGYACMKGLGPGYSSGEKETSSSSGLEYLLSPKSAIAQVSSGDSDTGTQNTRPVTDEQTSTSQSDSQSETGPGRSWIWSFLGSGFQGWIYKWEFILIGLPLIYILFRNSSPWPARKGKNIVICLDGTSNTPDQIERGFAAQTNVYKLFHMLKSDKAAYTPTGEFDSSLCKKYGEKQVGFYYAGVGNRFDNDPILQTLGMAAGLGAEEIVARSYLDLIRVYQPGDRVFITGFSRGAAIARLLAQAINTRGAPRAVWTLFLFGKHRTIWTSKVKVPVQISVLGCWDTVGSFGVAKSIFGINFQQLNFGKDMSVPDNVQQAYHMVALDEMRDSFDPTLMDPDAIYPERIVEVWFPGDHANIGGGWATDRLSDITLDFLLQRISSGYAVEEEQQGGENESWGLFLAAKKADKAHIALRKSQAEGGVTLVDPDPRGQVRQWFSNLYEYRPRTLPLHAVISEAVFERMRSVKPAYAPEALLNLNEALDERRDRIVSGIGKFAETESLDQEERDKVLEANNSLRLLRWPEYWEDVRASVRRRAGESPVEGDDDLLSPGKVLSNEALNSPASES